MFNYKEEYGWLTDICLNLTDACNLMCKYCFVSQHPRFMTYETAKAATDYILTNHKKYIQKFNNNINCSITFFGGEPTIQWDEVIVPLTNYIRKNNFPIDLSMTTNGTLLNQERIQFLKNNDIKILLSIDGAPETQNFNRPAHNGKKSFDLVYKNIPYILEAFPDTTFRGTIYAPTADKTFENYAFAAYLGFKNAFFIPDSRHPWTDEQLNNLHNEINKIFASMSYCFSNNQYPLINFSLINKIFSSILERDIEIFNHFNPTLKKSHSFMRCGLGTTSGSIGYDGNIYGCQEQTSLNQNSKFYIGNIFQKGIEPNLHIKLLEEYATPTQVSCENPELCLTCPVSDLCSENCCPSSSMDLYNNFFIDSEVHCLWFRWLVENCTLLMKKYVNENNETFKNYLNTICNYQKYFPESRCE